FLRSSRLLKRKRRLTPNCRSLLIALRTLAPRVTRRNRFQEGAAQSQPHPPSGQSLKTPGIIFDLDGTLVDSVYQHVATWNETLQAAHIAAPQWRIHRAIGMGGSLFLPKLLRDEGYRYSMSVIERLQTNHQRRFDRLIGRIE